MNAFPHSHPPPQKPLRHFLSLENFSKQEVLSLLANAALFKRGGKASFFDGGEGNLDDGEGNANKPLQNKMIALLFTKSSTRTRVAFERSIVALGGAPTFLSAGDIQLSRGEPLTDTLRVLSGYVEGIVVRTSSHNALEKATHASASVPVLNALTNLYHPTEALADAMTMAEILWRRYYASPHWQTMGKNALRDALAAVFSDEQTKLNKMKACYVGDANNVARSFALICHLLNMPCVIATPKGENFPQLPACLQSSKGGVRFIASAREAAKDADFIYTDTWVSMGNEEQKEQQRQMLKPYAVNEKLVALAKKNYTFLHCLPAYRGEEVASSIIDGPHSSVFTQSENRMHTIKAVLAHLF